jgi:drug/metabolite transporter (DMT)-like permease
MSMSARSKAVAFLLMATFIWGISSPLNRHALTLVNPWAYAAFRYLFGTLALLPLALRHGHRKAPGDYFFKRSGRLIWLKAGLILGSLLTVGSYLQFYGLTITTASKSGFITSLYVPMVAMFGFVLGQIPRREVWIGLAMCLAGLVLISGPSAGGGASAASGFNLGDAATLLADVIWAFHMMVMGYFAIRVNPWRLVASQAGVCCLISLIVAINTGHLCTWPQFVRALPFLGWGIMSVSVAYVCQAKAQVALPPTATAITLQFQPVLGAACGVFFLGEPLTWFMVAGAAVLVSGALISQRAGDCFQLEPGHRFYRLVRLARVMVVIVIASACLLSVLFTLP